MKKAPRMHTYFFREAVPGHRFTALSRISHCFSVVVGLAYLLGQTSNEKSRAQYRARLVARPSYRMGTCELDLLTQNSLDFVIS